MGKVTSQYIDKITILVPYIVNEIAPISCLGLHEPNVKGLILFNVDIHTPTCVQFGKHHHGHRIKTNICMDK